MSYFNTNFSSLEDAWGESFSRKSKGKTSKSNDPICNLYKQRKRNSSIPFTENKEPEFDVLYPTESYDKYYGYKDAHRYSRKPSRVSRYSSTLSSKKKKIQSSAPEPYDSDEERVSASLFKKHTNLKETNKIPSIRRSNVMNKGIREEMEIDRKRAINFKSGKKTEQQPRQQNVAYYEDSDSELDYSPYHSDNEEDGVIEEETDHYHIVRNKFNSYRGVDSDSDVASEYDSDEDTHESFKTKATYDAEKEYNNLMNDNNKFTTVSFSDSSRKLSKNTYADVLLFTITGILLIFIMEQFVQIGMKLKK